MEILTPLKELLHHLIYKLLHFLESPQIFKRLITIIFIKMFFIVSIF